MSSTEHASRIQCVDDFIWSNRIRKNAHYAGAEPRSFVRYITYEVRPSQTFFTHATSTKQGDGTTDGAGLIPRSLNDILVQTTEMKKRGWEFTIDLTFLEIYNETIQVRDCQKMARECATHSLMLFKFKQTTLSNTCARKHKVVMATAHNHLRICYGVSR